jgi:hypothetical protein
MYGFQLDSSEYVCPVESTSEEDLLYAQWW